MKPRYIANAVLAGSIALVCAAGLNAQARRGPAVPRTPGPRMRGVPRAARGPVPAEQLRRLLQMAPEQRERALANSALSTAERRRLQQRLDQLERMSPEQRERQLNRAIQLERMSPERRTAVTDQIQTLRAMTFEQRRAYLHSPEFDQNFSPDEQELIRERYPNAGK